MSKPQREKSFPKYYMPSEKLVNFVTKQLQLARIKAGMPGAAGDFDDAGVNAVNMRTAKFRVLDTVFQAMADLVYFFEQVSTQEELQEIFEADLKDLLGVRTDGHTCKLVSFNGVSKEAPAFERLIAAILIMYEENSVLDFRIKLAESLERLVYEKITNTKLPDLTPDVNRIMLEDLSRAKAWTNLYASKVFDEDKDMAPDRSFGFNYSYPWAYSTSFVKEVEWDKP